MRESKTAKRNRAIRKGLEFIYQVASGPECFTEHGSDLLNCFYFIATTSQDASLRRMARKMAKERARHWRSEWPTLPRKVDAEIISDYVHGSYAADRLGERDGALKAQIRRAAKRFPPADYLWFDPAAEPPPQDIPEECDCGATNPRGRKVCRKCQKSLSMISRYWIYLDALTRSYAGEKYGVTLGAPFASVIKWLPSLRPYPLRARGANDEFYEAIYAVTHVVYTLNDYSRYKLSPRWFPQEYEFLKMSLAKVIEMKDPETLGEVMDTLRSFGLTSKHPLIRQGTDFLLATQNADGSWGKVQTDDIYSRYHTTWTSIDGLREYHWYGERLSFPKLKPLLSQWAAEEANYSNS
jgi:hypothetical protein